ncbi:hypothetical protein PENTCL1PPCAC_23946, partial [Pristionchus entomophagus]
KMVDIKLNTRYLQSNRGLIKILQIVFGFILHSQLCGNWYDSCFGSGRLGFCSGLNYVALIVNILMFAIKLLNLGSLNIEHSYAVIGSILFLVASALAVWLLIEAHSSRHIGTAVLIIAELFLFQWDVKIMEGKSSN